MCVGTLDRVLSRLKWRPLHHNSPAGCQSRLGHTASRGERLEKDEERSEMGEGEENEGRRGESTEGGVESQDRDWKS